MGKIRRGPWEGQTAGPAKQLGGINNIANPGPENVLEDGGVYPEPVHTIGGEGSDGHQLLAGRDPARLVVIWICRVHGSADDASAAEFGPARRSSSWICPCARQRG